jgi:hypothetical protein
MNKLFVIDANCSWIRSLVGGLPEDWSFQTYRVYSPQWLPNGMKDALRSFRGHRIDSRTEETYVVVPGWNRLPRLSSLILEAVLAPSLRREPSSKTLFFTFPFYSHVARWARERFPRIRIAYHAHDPFEFYGYPAGYIRAHEDRIVPLCDHVFTISEKLREDFRVRYPAAMIHVLGNAASDSFSEVVDSSTIPDDLKRIRALGSPLIGCVGQINTSYDWRLLEAAASENPMAQFVFIGGLFEEGEPTQRIRQFFRCPNVHWLGAKPHERLKSYMDYCDILLNPLKVNAQNDRRDTLRLYDYLTTNAFVISTPIHGAMRHGDFVNVPRNEGAMIAMLGQMPGPLTPDKLAKRRAYIVENTWSARGRQLAEALEQDSR